MNPLEMFIEVEDEDWEEFGMTGRFPPPPTKYGIFTPPEGAHRDFDPYKRTLKSLRDFEGFKLKVLYKALHNPRSYLYESRPRNLLADVDQLHAMGAIDVKGDRIVLRTEVPGPLELLARCATD